MTIIPKSFSMKKVILFAFLLSIFSIQAQEKKVVSFDNDTFDFGVVKEEIGRITHTFNFKNTTDAPITITNVKASCGCTTPEWSKDPIRPGATGKVTATYSTTNRPGSFYKSITVTLMRGTETFTEILYIKGDVTPKVQTTEPVAQTK